MFKVYKNKASGDQVLAVEITSRGKLEDVRGEDVKKGTYRYLERPYSAVVVAPRKPMVGDFIVQGEDGNKLAGNDTFRNKNRPQGQDIL